VRILHCPTSTGGNAWGLSQAERKLGLDSTVLIFQNTWLDYPADINLRLDRSSKLVKYLRMSSFFLEAVRKYDVFHFNFGLSLFFIPRLNLFLDVPILKQVGKKIVVTYQGCDARQREFCINNFPISACMERDCAGGQCNERTDVQKRKRIALHGKYADRVFALNPDLLYVIPNGEFLPYASVDVREWVPSQEKGNRKNFNIFHAPTNRGAKGTKYILEVVEKLREKHKRIELNLVENLPHAKVKEIMQAADLVIDQLLVGWYGAVAVEAMALGKPVVCYVREEDLRFIPRRMEEDLPIINANPENLYQVLDRHINNRKTLSLIGEKSRSYVERYHDPIKIAQQMKELYESLLCAA
jgi:glycosyltransferase involved in cell wall biosynthesis